MSDDMDSKDTYAALPPSAVDHSPAGRSPALHFPRIVAATLSGTTLVLPDSLDTSLGIVMLAFRRHAQAVVDSWMTPLARRLAGHDVVRLYEVPMLAGGWRVMSGFIDNGMRSGIPAHKHGMVATYYGDVHRVRAALGIHDLDSAYIYLMKADGEIQWHAEGWAAPRRIEELLEHVDLLAKTR